jgi:hypothetical protein
MDRYFYSVEMDGDRKVVHMSGNIYRNDVDETEACYRVAEWTFFYLTLDEIKELLSNYSFYEHINEMVNYLGHITKQEAVDLCNTYWDGGTGNNLHICEVNEDTPCGYYWFE